MSKYKLGTCVNLRSFQEDDDNANDYDLQLWLVFTISHNHSGCVYFQTSEQLWIITLLTHGWRIFNADRYVIIIRETVLLLCGQ